MLVETILNLTFVSSCITQTMKAEKVYLQLAKILLMGKVHEAADKIDSVDKTVYPAVIVYPALKMAGYYVIPSENFECLSVRQRFVSGL